MDLYTMNENFIPQYDIDQFQSVIWTERYSSAGEVQLVVPALGEYIQLLAEGTYLGLAGSPEVMQLKTQSVEGGLLTVAGKSMLGFLDERMHWTKTTDSAQPIGDLTVESAKLGELIADRVDKMVINPVAFPFSDPWNKLNLQWDLEKIDNLELGDIDHSGEAQRWTVPVGPLYSSIQPLAEKDGLGLSLYLYSADAEAGYVLKFKTYRGVDRTSSQELVDVLQLTPDTDTLTGLKEVRSIEGYKNVVYVNYKNELSIHYEDPDNIPTGLNRRVLLTDAQGEPVGHKPPSPVMDRLFAYGGTSYSQGGGAYNGGAYQYTPPEVTFTPEEIAAFREQNAKDALANHNYIRALDGQVSQNNQYKFGKDYGLGDIIELEGLTGVINKARVTEFIRAQDKQGSKEYPTLSVIS